MGICGQVQLQGRGFHFT